MELILDFDSLLNITLVMLTGAKTTVLTFFVVIILSLPFGFFITLLANSKIKVISYSTHLFIYIIRGTPLLLQLLFIYFALPIIPYIGDYLKFDRLTAALIGFTINYSAYFAEIFRGGLLAIDKGQYEASKVLGLSKFQTTRYIIIPQMIRVVLPPLSNESITLVKDTALLYAIGVPELLHVTKTLVNRDVSIMPFFIAGVIYLVMILFLTLLFKYLEKNFRKSMV